MKIKKHQTGGYMTYTPLPMVPQQTAPQQAGPDVPDKKEDDGLDKNILEKMIGNGVTQDVMQYSKQVNAAYQQYSMMDDNQRQSYMGRQLRMIMKGDLGELTRLARSKKILDEAKTKASEQGSLDELAVTNNGILAKDKDGRITTLSFMQYAKNKDKYQALTNSELADEREYNPQLLNNAGVASVISYGNGMDKVKDEIMKIVQSIGSTSVSKSTGAFGDATGSDDSMQALEQAAAAGAFKIKEGSVQQSNSAQIQRAQAIMWDRLAPGSRATLLGRAAQLVDDPSKVELAAKNLAAAMLDPHETVVSKEVHDETYKKLMSGKAAAEKTAEMGPAELAFNGIAQRTPIKLIGPGGATIESIGNLLPNTLYQGADGKRASLQDAVNINKVAKVTEAFTMNGDKVNPRNAVVTGNMYIQWLPTVQQADGTMRIDEAGAKKWAAIQASNPGISKDELAKQYEGALHLTKLVTAEATSFDDKGNYHSWFDSRDPNYYQAASSDEKQYALEQIDPKGARLKHLFGDNNAHKHLIFMPAKSEAYFRDADGNHAIAPQQVFNIDPSLPQPFNSGQGGVNIEQGMDYVQPQQPPANLTSDYFGQQ